jgi:hypothetical protein
MTPWDMHSQIRWRETLGDKWSGFFDMETIAKEKERKKEMGWGPERGEGQRGGGE